MTILYTIIVSQAADCDFEEINLCKYFQDDADTFDWTRRAGGTPSVETGPGVDHTYATTNGILNIFSQYS